MVYAGYINKTIVAGLQANGCNAIGICGADGNAVRAHKRIAKEGGIDYGFAGDVDEVNAQLLAQWLQEGLVPVVAPVTHDRKGQLLNTNADTMAAEIAKGMSVRFETQLLYCFEKKGVLRDPSDDDSVIDIISPTEFENYKAAGIVSAGMIPKLQNTFAALAAGVNKIRIGHARQITQMVLGESGTLITDAT